LSDVRLSCFSVSNARKVSDGPNPGHSEYPQLIAKTAPVM
jgi:hypothetical protein